MNGIRYIEKQPYKVKIREKFMEGHHKRLNLIKNSKACLLDCTTPDFFNLKISKRNTNKFRKEELYRENLSLLEKLTALTEKKLSNKANIKHDRYSSVKSVYNNKQKNKEQKKINRENEYLVLRLSNISPSINRKLIEKEYLLCKKYSSNISKFGTPSKIFSTSLKFESNLEIPLDKTSKAELALLRKSNAIDNSTSFKKQWKIAAISPTPSLKYTMAVPIALD